MNNMKKVIYGAAVAVSVASCSSRQPVSALNEMTEAGEMNDSLLYMFTGSYSDVADEGVGVYLFNQETAVARRLGGVSGVSNPSFLIPDGINIYCVGEDVGLTSTINHLLFSPSDSTKVLSFADSVPTGGGAPCFVNISPDGRFVLTANYMGGNITVARRDSAGILQSNPMVVAFPPASHPTETNGEPRLHSVNFTPDGSTLIAADLGTDRLHIFPVIAGSDSLIDPGNVTHVEMRPGMGPRHMDFSSDGRFAYVLGELSGEIAVVNLRDGSYTQLQYLPADTVGGHGSGDIHLSPDGRFLYASNRLKADGIAVFSVDEASGLLTPAGYQLTGIHPRNFAITPNGRWMLVACRDSDAIEIYSLDSSTGLLSPTGRPVSTPRPVCVRFAVPANETAAVLLQQL